MTYSALLTIASLLELPTLLLLLLLVGIALSWTRWSGAGRLIASVSAIALAVFATTPASVWIARQLEDSFPPVVLAEQPAGAIILCEAIHVDLAASRKDSSLTHAAECLTEPASLARRYPGMRLIYVADAISPEARKTQIAAVREFWLSLGIPETQMLLISGSPDPRDNVAQLKAAAPGKDRKGWLLVTSAMNMPRLAYTFASQGLAVTPYPVDYRTAAGANAWFDAQNIKTVAASSRELALGWALRLFGSHIERTADAS